MNAGWLSSFSFLLLSIAAFYISLQIYKHGIRFIWLHSLLHPLVTGSAMVAFVLWWLQVDYRDYQSANWPLLKLLGPTTVALAIPLHNEFHHIRAMARPLLISLLAGTLLSTGLALLCAWIMGGSTETLLAVTPKSVTTPIALGIAEKIMAEPGLVAGIVIFTGVVGAVAAVPVFRLLGITDERVQGFALGVNAHGAGTARAFEISPLCGALSSLAMSMAGAFIALILPSIVLAIS